MRKEDNLIIYQVLANLRFLDDFAVALKNGALSTQTMTEFYQKWLQDIEWEKISSEEYGLMNGGVILTSLYGTIVYPKEKFYDEIPEIPLASLDSNKWGRINFEIPNQLPNDMTLRNLVRRLRNALSHSRVELTNDPVQEIVFSFEDQVRISGQGLWITDFRVNIGVHEVHKFIYLLNKGLIQKKWDDC